MRDARDTFVEWHENYAPQHEEDPLCTCLFGAYTSLTTGALSTGSKSSCIGAVPTARMMVRPLLGVAIAVITAGCTRDVIPLEQFSL